MPPYKTIALELLKGQYPALHERLRKERKLLKTVDGHAITLKTAHLSWMEELRQANPGSAEEAISSEALELAIEHLQGLLPSEPQTDGDAETFSLDAAMAYLNHP